MLQTGLSPICSEIALNDKRKQILRTKNAKLNSQKVQLRTACMRQSWFFTGRLRPLETNSYGSMVLLVLNSCSFLIQNTDLWVSLLQTCPVDCICASLSLTNFVTNKAFYYLSTLHQFWTTNTCHSIGVNLICFNLFVLQFLASSFASKCGSWHAECRANCLEPSGTGLQL